MNKADTCRKAIDKVMVQGNNDEIGRLFEEIIESAGEEFTEDNYYTLVSFLMERFVTAIHSERPISVDVDVLMKGLQEELIKP